MNLTKKTYAFLGILSFIFLLIGAFYYFTSSAPPPSKGTIGFIQVGDESEWRLAMTNNIVSTLSAKGYNVIYSNANQRQENQIKSIRSFIRQEVDYIVLAPVVEFGWDDVLEEIALAHIPLILVNRNIIVKNEELQKTIVAFAGIDNESAAKECAEVLLQSIGETQKRITIVELLGNKNSDVTRHRKIGSNEAFLSNENVQILSSYYCGFSKVTAKEKVLEHIALTKSLGITTNVIFAHNDDMAFGAMEALDELGLKPGKDVIIASFDGVRGALIEVEKGRISTLVENPVDYGSVILDIINKYENNEIIARKIFLPYKIITQNNTAEVLKERKY